MDCFGLICNLLGESSLLSAAIGGGVCMNSAGSPGVYVPPKPPTLCVQTCGLNVYAIALPRPTGHCI